MSETLPTLLRTDIAPLNQGSFGVCPPEVFAEYQRWQREFEYHPDGFMRVVFERMAAARAALAAYLGAADTNIGFVTNATMGVNVVTHSLRSQLKPGDEILTTDHEYNACNNAWRFCCEKTGARYVHQPMPPPMTTAAAFVEQLWKGVTEHTRVIYLSHITSPTALIFPIREIAERARAEGILTVVDGAHAPGHIALSLDALGADFYTGNCHKWMLSPKGTAFIYGRPEVQHMIEPLIVGHHYGGHTRMTGNPFVDYVEFFGTRDVSGFLTVPTAIDFMRKNNWDAMRERCHGLAMAVRERIAALYDIAPGDQLCPPTHAWVGQMASCRIPDSVDIEAYVHELRDVRGVEVPVLEWGGHKYIRVSVQYYTTEEHLDRLIEALSALRSAAY